ncbi:pirin isoform X1 [Delphinapterus leucas]|uniref:Pirin isoform X1 n=1 Tax=Delphinapterus leucas TaxID=9749 RepID=A0A2Y9M9M4_DELLE|nr:pirin isoform X1 [Delphinapterus leucas]
MAELEGKSSAVSQQPPIHSPQPSWLSLAPATFSLLYSSSLRNQKGIYNIKKWRKTLKFSDSRFQKQKYTSTSVKSQHQIFRLSELSPEEDKGFASQQEKQYQHQRLLVSRPGYCSGPGGREVILEVFIRQNQILSRWCLTHLMMLEDRTLHPAGAALVSCVIQALQIDWESLASEKCTNDVYSSEDFHQVNSSVKSRNNIARLQKPPFKPHSVTNLPKSKSYTHTPTLYLDFRLGQGAKHSQPIPKGWTSFIYTISGNVYIGPDDTQQKIEPHHTAVLGEGDSVQVENKDPERNHFVLIAGEPLREPVVQHGPFVMNTDEEIS